MARTKKTGRCPTREMPSPLPCLSEYVEEDWYEEESEKKAYSERLSQMQIIPPRYVGDGAIPEDRYPEFWRDFSECRYYPRFVAAAFASVAVDDKLGDEGQGMGFENAGTTFRGGSNPHSEWNEFEKMDAARVLRLYPASSGKYHISRMTTTHRLLLYVISRILIPRKSNHGTATEEDLILLWAMINEKQINWPYLMAHKLVDYSHGKFVVSSSDFAITSKNINQMRRDLANSDAAEEDVPERNVRPRADVPPTTEPTAEAPTETSPAAEVPSTDPPGVDEVVATEVTRTDDPAVEGTTEVAPVVED
ncbi:hypothetical protein PIB30_025414 [Stylosanthes scabra]|uniref:Uncharacterized protein n=1 Tax=Stylosanthes scabra TaxID=79078 RepID=A0ABU6RAH7_9FABA|nr:hypothetical protein [Stylosanthes scabra]